MHPIVSGFKCEREFSVYQSLGVHHFKKILPFGDFWIRIFNTVFNKKLKLVNTKQKAIVWFIFTFSVECIHLLGFLILLGFTINAALVVNYESVLEWTFINSIVNIYPMMVQRYNRIRLIRLFKIKSSDLSNFEIKF